MTPEDYARMRDLFDRAMTLPVDERRAFVDAHAPSGDPLRSDLLAMIADGDDSRFLMNAFLSGAMPPPQPESDIPAQVGPYKILRPLGRGGMGAVYLALRNDDVFKKVVALKIINIVNSLDGSVEAGFVARFRQERQILAGLDHPNIARILDGGSTEDGRPFYVMEYVAGSPIDDYCARVNADVPTRLRMITQVCDAVDYLHDHAIAHRDIKPGNILVTADGRVKLVDFGIARIDTVDGLVASASPAGKPTMLMTPGYAAPEQLAGRTVGKSADIYSVGVVLYELLAGRLPYADAEGRPNLAAQLAGPEPKPPSQELPSVKKKTTRGPDSKWSHPDLDRIVLMAIQRDPLQRYSTARLLSEDLRRCLEGRPVAARSAGWTYVFGKFISRNRVAAALAVLLVLAVFGGVYTAVGMRIDRARLEGKEQEVARIVAMLNERVARWGEPNQAVPVAEKVGDVQTANRLMASDDLRTLSARAPDPMKLKQVIADLRRVLERADAISRDLPVLRKEIATVYRQIGDFQARAPLAAVADVKQAGISYQRAAKIAVDIRTAEPAWARTELTELAGRMLQIGSPLEVAPEPVAEAPPEPSAPPPPVETRRPASTSAARAARNDAPDSGAAPAVNAEERDELVQRLKTMTANATRAHANLDALRDSLAARGQTLRADVLTSMAQVDALVEQVRTALDENDLAAAEDGLRRASYELRKVFQVTGG